MKISLALIVLLLAGCSMPEQTLVYSKDGKAYLINTWEKGESTGRFVSRLRSADRNPEQCK